MNLKTFTLSLLVMATPAIASAADYYVSPAGAGEKNGTSAENAWGIDELLEQFNSANAANFQNGDNVYFAAGKYVSTTTLYVKMGINLIGAEGAERTVFNGDANGDGEINEGDRDRVFQINTAVGVGTTEKCVTITNIDFEGLYIAQGGNDTKGAIYLDNCGAEVTVSKCNFKDLVNTGQGANAFFSKRSTLKVVDCTFTGNKAANRGVVARLQGDIKKGWTTFERCLFADNEATGAAGDPCGIVMMQHGQQMNFVNCSFINNKVNGKGSCIWDGTAPDGNYSRILNVVSCTFADNSSAAEAEADQMEILLNATSKANILNSIVLGGITAGDNIALQGNITDKTRKEVFGDNVLTDGVLAPIAKNETMEGFAAAVEALNPAINPAADITLDQTGAVRENNVIGAYDFAPSAIDDNPDDGGGETAIKTVGAQNQQKVAYNLNGQRVTSGKKGIIILNGKKVVSSL